MAGDNVIVAVRVRPPLSNQGGAQAADWVVQPELQEGDEDGRTTAIVTQNPGNGDIRRVDVCRSLLTSIYKQAIACPPITFFYYLFGIVVLIFPCCFTNATELNPCVRLQTVQV